MMCDRVSVSWYIASQEDMFMKAWLGLIAERNALVRHQTELSLQ